MHWKLPFIRLPEPSRGIFFLIYAASYRVALPVTQLVRYPAGGYCYPLCPRCGKSLDREYVGFCDRCGQKLRWDKMEDAQILTAPLPDPG